MNTVCVAPVLALVASAASRGKEMRMFGVEKEGREEKKRGATCPPS